MSEAACVRGVMLISQREPAESAERVRGNAEGVSGRSSYPARVLMIDRDITRGELEGREGRASRRADDTAASCMMGNAVSVAEFSRSWWKSEEKGTGHKQTTLLCH
jgi:hypothetical protein